MLKNLFKKEPKYETEREMIIRAFILEDNEEVVYFREYEDGEFVQNSWEIIVKGEEQKLIKKYKSKGKTIDISKEYKCCNCHFIYRKDIDKYIEWDRLVDSTLGLNLNIEEDYKRFKEINKQINELGIKPYL